MNSLYKVLAIGVMLLHLAVVLVIMFGWLLPQFWFVYGACLFGSAISYVLQRKCVLTQVENYYRQKAGMSVVTRTFLGHWAEVMFGSYTPSDQWVVRIAVTFFIISIPVYLCTLYQFRLSFLL